MTLNNSSRLEISLSVDIKAPTPEHNLLVAFYFGESPPPHVHEAIVCTDLVPLDRDYLYECWWYKGDIAFSQYESTRIAPATV